jgi:hypothetical protein
MNDRQEKEATSDSEPFMMPEPEPEPIPEHWRKFVRVSEGTDAELEAQGARRMTVWKEGNRLDIWVPAAGAELSGGEIEEIVWNHLDTSEEDLSWWLTWRDGSPVDPKHCIEHEDEFNWHQGTEEEADAYAQLRDEELAKPKKQATAAPELKPGPTVDLKPNLVIGPEMKPELMLGHDAETAPRPRKVTLCWRSDTKKQFTMDTKEGDTCEQLQGRLAEMIGKRAEIVVNGRKWRDEPVSEMQAQLGPGGYVVVVPQKETVHAEWNPPAPADKKENLKVHLIENGRMWEVETGRYARIEDLRNAIARDRNVRQQNIMLRQGGDPSGSRAWCSRTRTRR